MPLNDIHFTGNWATMNSPFIAAVRIQENNEFYYGWIKLKYDNENVSLLIVDYAINLDPDAFNITGTISNNCNGSWTLSE